MSRKRTRRQRIVEKRAKQVEEALVPRRDIFSDPAIKEVIQKGILERAFHDSLFPKLVYKPDKDGK